MPSISVSAEAAIAAFKRDSTKCGIVCRLPDGCSYHRNGCKPACIGRYFRFHPLLVERCKTEKLHIPVDLLAVFEIHIYVDNDHKWLRDLPTDRIGTWKVSLTRWAQAYHVNNRDNELVEMLVSFTTHWQGEVEPRVCRITVPESPKQPKPKPLPRTPHGISIDAYYACLAKIHPVALKDKLVKANARHMQTPDNFNQETNQINQMLNLWLVGRVLARGILQMAKTSGVSVYGLVLDSWEHMTRSILDWLGADFRVYSPQRVREIVEYWLRDPDLRKRADELPNHTWHDEVTEVCRDGRCAVIYYDSMAYWGSVSARDVADTIYYKDLFDPAIFCVAFCTRNDAGHVNNRENCVRFVRKCCQLSDYNVNVIYPPKDTHHAWRVMFEIYRKPLPPLNKIWYGSEPPISRAQTQPQPQPKQPRSRKRSTAAAAATQRSPLTLLKARTVIFRRRRRSSFPRNRRQLRARHRHFTRPRY